MVRPFSGLGLLEVFLGGGANEEDADGVGVLDEDAYADWYCELFVPTTARSELYLGRKAGR